MVRAVLFDWDGTLSDSSEPTFRCYVRLFAEYGIAFDREAYVRTYSPNWYRTFRAVGLAEEHWKVADRRWVEHFSTEQVELLDGAREVLETLSARGIITGVVTSGERVRVEPELDRHGVASHLHERVYGCQVQQKKPHPEGLLRCLEQLRVRPDEAVFVGDSPEDIEMARAAGVYAVAVSGGYPNYDALMASKPNAYCRSIRDLIAVLDAM